MEDYKVLEELALESSADKEFNIVNRTVKIPLLLSKEQSKVLLDTAIVCQGIFEIYAVQSKEHKSSSAQTVHKYAYPVAREKYPQVSACLLPAVGAQACHAMKSYNALVPQINKRIRKYNSSPKHTEKKTLREKFDIVPKRSCLSIPLTKLTFTRRGDLCSIATVQGRLKVLAKIPEWFSSAYPFNPNEVQSALVKFSRGKAALHLSYNIKVDFLQSSGDLVGVDRGLYNVCTLSTGELVSSKTHIAIKRKYQYNRSKLQQKGTRSAKRKLKKLSGREKRFMQDVNHCISKRLANKEGVSEYVLEDLIGIRKVEMLSGKKLRSWLSNWSFLQLERFLEYKCKYTGKSVYYVDPRYTSQKCSSCGTVTQNARQKSRYNCPVCGYKEHADVNAAINIKDNYVKAKYLEQATSTSQ